MVSHACVNDMIHCCIYNAKPWCIARVNLHFMKFSSRRGCEQVLPAHTCKISPTRRIPHSTFTQQPDGTLLPFFWVCAATKQTCCCGTACKQRRNRRCFYLWKMRQLRMTNGQIKHIKAKNRVAWGLNKAMVYKVWQTINVLFIKEKTVFTRIWK